MHISKQSPLSLSISKLNSYNLRSLDALRGLLAMYVLAGHCRWLLWVGYASWSKESHPLWQKGLVVLSSMLRYGHEAVIIFFVLSGFFIHLRIAKQLSDTNSFQFNLAKFIRHRSHRLIPPYAFALGVTVLFDAIGRWLYPTLYQAATGDSLLDVNFAVKGYSLSSVIPAFLFLPSSLGEDFGSNGPLWSLAYEIMYYAMYPLWLLLRKQSAGIAYGTGLLIAIVSSYLVSNQFLHGVLTHYPIWLCGAIMAELLTRKSKLCLFKFAFAWPVIGAFFFAAFVGLHISSLNSAILFLYAVLGTSVVLIGLNLPIEFLSSPLHKFFEKLGLQSYTLYICHFPMVTLISAWVIETQGSRPDYGWLALGGFLVSMLLCNLCFYLCEYRFLHARIKLNPQ